MRKVSIDSAERWAPLLRREGAAIPQCGNPDAAPALSKVAGMLFAANFRD